MEEIGRCRTLTDRPFGVNLTMLPSINPPPYERYLEVILRAQVKAIETAGKVPPRFIAAAKAAGLKVIHKCVRCDMRCQPRGTASMPFPSMDSSVRVIRVTTTSAAWS